MPTDYIYSINLKWTTHVLIVTVGWSKTVVRNADLHMVLTG